MYLHYFILEPLVRKLLFAETSNEPADKHNLVKNSEESAETVSEKNDNKRRPLTLSRGRPNSDHKAANAATKIQSVWRGYNTRKKLKFQKKDDGNKGTQI